MKAQKYKINQEVTVDGIKRTITDIVKSSYSGKWIYQLDSKDDIYYEEDFIEDILPGQISMEEFYE